MPMSTRIEDEAVKIGYKTKRKSKNIGMCIKCGHKLTFCGRPFTAEIPCVNCLYINTFKESQQPVGGHW